MSNVNSNNLASFRSVSETAAKILKNNFEKESDSICNSTSTYFPRMSAQDELKLAEAVTLLPAEDKSAYEEAMKMARDVVEEESNPMLFLLVENFDLHRAAKRLTNYWRSRKNAFGPGTYLKRVLDLTENGALNAEDKDFLRSGINVALTCDSQGCTVFCNNLSRLRKTAFKEREHRMRGAFFWWTKIANENPLSQTLGIVVIKLVEDADGSNFLPSHFRQFVVKNFEEVMPLKLKSFHLCCTPPPGSLKHFVKTIIPQTVKAFGKEYGSLVKIHVASSKQGSLVSQLEKYGMPKQCLVTSVGGTWSYDLFDSWFDQKVANKSSVSPSKLQELADIALRENSRKVETSGLEGPTKTISAADDQEESRGEKKEAIASSSTNLKLQNLIIPKTNCIDPKIVAERKARKRELDAIYARNRRKREKQEEDRLQNDCSVLKHKNVMMEQENARLEKLLLDAKEKVAKFEATFTSNISPTEFQDYPKTPGPSTLNVIKNNTQSADVAQGMTIDRKLAGELLSTQNYQNFNVCADPRSNVGSQFPIADYLERRSAAENAMVNPSIYNEAIHRILKSNAMNGISRGTGGMNPFDMLPSHSQQVPDTELLLNRISYDALLASVPNSQNWLRSQLGILQGESRTTPSAYSLAMAPLASPVPAFNVAHRLQNIGNDHPIGFSLGTNHLRTSQQWGHGSGGGDDSNILLNHLLGKMSKR